MDQKIHSKSSVRPIVVTGFPYAFPYYFEVFKHISRKDDFVFVLPKLWSIKKGKIIFKLEHRAGLKTIGLTAVSYGGRKIRGMFKGWMPAIKFTLPYLKFKYKSKVLYSCSEPNLFTTLYNGINAKVWGYKHILFTWQNVRPEDRMSGLKLKLSNLVVKINLALADGVICGNRKAEEIVKNFKPKIRTLVVPISGVDMEKFRPGLGHRWRQEQGLSDKKIVLFYGSLDKRKGLDILVRAFSLVDVSNSVLVIIGTGPEKDKLTKLAGELKLEERIVFIDWMKNTDLPLVLNSADLFVYPSVPVGGWEEQFGYAMAEASACQVPVVASRTGSIDEVVADGKSGILVEPKNSQQLADAITKVLSDEGLAQAMGQSGRKYIEDNFSHEVIAGKIENFLRSFV